MENNFHKAYKEILELLKYMPKKDVEKIPEEMIYTFKMKMDTEHQFEIDESIPLDKQDFLEETKDILSNMFRDYWATPRQREKILAREKLEKEKLEEERRKKYNPDNIFKNTYTDPNPRDPFAENGISYKKEKNFMNSDIDDKTLDKLNKQTEKFEKKSVSNGIRTNSDNEFVTELEENEQLQMTQKKKWYQKIIESLKSLFSKK